MLALCRGKGDCICVSFATFAFNQLVRNSEDFTRDSPPANWVALVQRYPEALTGDRNKAFEYLDKAYAEEDSELMACIRFPAFDSLHADPRYADLMRRLGLPQ